MTDEEAVDRELVELIIREKAPQRLPMTQGQMPNLLHMIAEEPLSVIRFIFEIGREYERRAGGEPPPTIH